MSVFDHFEGMTLEGLIIRNNRYCKQILNSYRNVKKDPLSLWLGMGCGSSKVACSVSQLPVSREKNFVDKQEDTPVGKINQSTSIEDFKLKISKIGYIEKDLKQADDIADNVSFSCQYVFDL